ncbi:MAG: hypothetical protein IKZ13_07950 [Akkermansia sp.]|nr:hypothetical protein [Akkermansia sp.]
MGFSKPSPAPAPAVQSEPPVVAEVVQQDAQADYDQKAARRKGLLSTVLTSPKHSSAAALASANRMSNTTLG